MSVLQPTLLELAAEATYPVSPGTTCTLAYAAAETFGLVLFFVQTKMSNGVANVFNTGVTCLCLILVGAGWLAARRAETTICKREAKEVAVLKSTRRKREDDDKVRKLGV